MKSVGIPELEKAVKEYYEYQGDRNMHAVRFIENRHSARLREKEYGRKTKGYEMLLARFIDENNVKYSSLMEYQRWADGHWDVTEIFFCPRECEKKMIRMFVESEEYI